jgi:hypothetical protein
LGVKDLLFGALDFFPPTVRDSSPHTPKGENSKGAEIHSSARDLIF